MEEIEKNTSGRPASGFTRRNFLKGSALAAATVAASGSLLSLASCAQPSGEAAMSFVNVSEGVQRRVKLDAISLSETRTFKVVVPVADSKVDDLAAKIDQGAVTWTLKRDIDQAVADFLPHQWLGGALEEWKTIETPMQPAQDYFTDVSMSAAKVDGVPSIEMTLTANMLFGFDGIDFRCSGVGVRHALDYVGTYTLECLIDGSPVASMPVSVNAYDTFRAQLQIADELPALVDAANENGLYAELQTIGTSAHGRDIYAAIVAKSKQDVDDYQALKARMESEPDKVKAEVEAGSLSYKVPVLYSNVHSDEVIGSDGVMEFFKMLSQNKPFAYRTITGLTDKGNEQLSAEMKADGTDWSTLIADKVTGVGYIQGNGVKNPTHPDSTADVACNDVDPFGPAHMTVAMTDEEFRSYYNVEEFEFDPSAILEHVIFLLVPMENPDGRAYCNRTNGNGFDLNRDNTYQTQPETRAMTHFIASWDPISMHEIHGFYTQFQCEPCTPPHDPNNEYDLFIDQGIDQGEAFLACAISNNPTINASQMPMRDYLKVREDGTRFWDVPFDDMTSSYTPQYAMLHGANAFTIELPYGSQDAVEAVMHGFIGNAVYIATPENKDRMFTNLLERFRRGIENIDADDLRPYYVSQTDGESECADAFRPRYPENGNFFPEYYVIPMASGAQGNRAGAAEMVEYLLRNCVRVSMLSSDMILPANEFRGEKSYHAGDIVIEMRQAKRNMANAALYPNLALDNWGGLYSEPVTNFPDFRGFDIDVITTQGAFDAAALEDVAAAPEVQSAVSGEGAAAIIANDTVYAVRTVNSLLDAGKKVGLIVEGDHKGDFIVAASDLDSVKDTFVFDAVLTDDVPVAKVIKAGIKVHVPGDNGEFMTDDTGKPFGVKNYKNLRSTSYNWDRFALTEQLGFMLASSVGEADVLVGCQSLSEDEVAAVKGGKAYVGHGAGALSCCKDAGLDIDFVDEGSDYDALTTIEFADDSLITAPYRSRGDVLFYGFGGAWLTKIPEGAIALMSTTDDPFIEGFMSAEHAAKYKNTMQAFEFASDGWNAVLFANSLTNKAHQLHEYRYLATSLYSRLLGDDFAL